MTYNPFASAGAGKEMIEGIIKNDIKHFLFNPDNLKKYIISKNEKSLNSDFEVVEYENKKDKINKDIDRLLELYLNNEVHMYWANGGGSSPSVYLKNPKDLVQDLINAEDNSINVDLTFKKKIKVI